MEEPAPTNEKPETVDQESPRTNRRRFLGLAGAGASVAVVAATPGVAGALDRRGGRDGDGRRGGGNRGNGGNDGDGNGRQLQAVQQNDGPDRFSRLFDRNDLGRRGNADMREALVELSLPGGILDANDPLEVGPVRLITEPELSPNNIDNPNHPAGTTFYGQFLDHDITRDASSRLGRPTPLRRSTNLRTARFDLDSVYGGGPDESPDLYEDDDLHFRVESGGLFEDLPRNADGEAIISDPRNDENLMISGLQVAFLKFHNAVIDRVLAGSLSGSAAFAEANRLVRWHHQWMTLHEYLPLVVGQDMIDDILTNGRQHFTDDQPRIPVEFQTSAYRFGHSLVRPSYRASRRCGASGTCCARASDVSLRTRLAFVTSLLVIMGVATTGAASWISTRAELVDEVDDFLRTRSEQLVEEAEEGRLTLNVPTRGNGNNNGDGGNVERPDAFIATDSNSLAQQITSTGELVAQSRRGTIPITETDLELAEKDGNERIRNITIDGRKARTITRHVRGEGDTSGAIQVARFMDDTDRALAGLLTRILVIAAVLTAIAAAAGWFFALRTTRPLRKLTATAEHVSATQDLATPIEVDRTDEVGSLATSFGAMLNALRRSREQQHQLIQDAAHEVRTPLTTLRANIELLERAPDIGEPHRSDLLRSLRSELEALTTLFNEVIELATDERGEAPFDAHDLNEPADRAARVFTSRSGRQLVTTYEGVEITGNTALLERAIGNLLHNADKYSPAGLPVELEIRGRRVTVRDQGSGIAPEDRDRIFDRFYRSDHTRAMAGSGLGLAIVKQVVDRHGGTVFAGTAPGGGAEVGFEL